MCLAQLSEHTGKKREFRPHGDPPGRAECRREPELGPLGALSLPNAKATEARPGATAGWMARGDPGRHITTHLTPTWYTPDNPLHWVLLYLGNSKIWTQLNYTEEATTKSQRHHSWRTSASLLQISIKSLKSVRAGAGAVV